MRQAYPDWGPQEIKEKLRASTVIYTGDQSPDENGRDPDNTYGWGRVNALRALDAGPTATSAILSGPSGENGWFLGTVDVSLSSVDTVDLLGFTTGPRELYWKLDGEPAGSHVTLNGLAADGELTGLVEVSGDAIHEVTAWGVDNGGNLEVEKTWPVRIDTEPPATAPNVAGTAGTSPWYTSAVEVTLACQDATSGCSQSWYSLDSGAETEYTDPFPITEDGIHTVDYHSRDVAGNIEEGATAEIHVDATAPTTSHQLAPDGNGTQLTLTAEDATSGLDEIRFRVNEGDWQRYLAPVRLMPGDVARFHSVDVAGNTDPIQQVAVPQPAFLQPRQGHLTVGTGNISIQHALPAQGNLTTAVTAGTVHFELAVDPLGTTLTEVNLTVTNATGEVLHHDAMTLDRTTENGRLVYTDAWEPPAGPRFGLTAQATVENDQGAFAASSVMLSTLGSTVETTAQRAPG